MATRELEAELKLQRERAAFEAEKQRLRQMLALPPEQRPVELLTPQELRDQLDRNTLRNQRIKQDMWNIAIILDQRRHYGREYTI